MQPTFPVIFTGILRQQQVLWPPLPYHTQTHCVSHTASPFPTAKTVANSASRLQRIQRYASGLTEAAPVLVCRARSHGARQVLILRAPAEVARGLLIRAVGVGLPLIWTCNLYLKVEHARIHESFTGFLETSCHHTTDLQSSQARKHYFHNHNEGTNRSGLKKFSRKTIIKRLKNDTNCVIFYQHYLLAVKNDKQLYYTNCKT
jgi:hypothetical protein